MSKEREQRGMNGILLKCYCNSNLEYYSLLLNGIIKKNLHAVVFIVKN